MDNDNDKLAALVAKGDVPEDLLSWIAHCLDGMDSDKELYDSLSQSWGLMGEELFNHLAYSYNILIAWRAYHEQIRGLDKGLQVTVLFVAIEAAKEKVSPSTVLKEGFTEDGSLADNGYGDIIRRAFASRDRYLDAWEAMREPPEVNSKAPADVTYPLDKVNSKTWTDTSGLRSEDGLIQVATERAGSKKDATVLYGVWFDELEEYVHGVSELTQYDKRVFIATCGLFRANGPYMTINQICETMGNGSKRPSKNQLDLINKSLNKMMRIRIRIDNSDEVKVNKGYPLINIETYLLPFKRIKVSAWGNTTEGIELYEEPLLMRFARERKQISTISKEVLAIPLSQTEGNLALEDYLIRRIAAMKRPKSRMSKDILLETTYKEMGIAGKDSKARQARSRLAVKVRACLDHFKQTGYINGYTETKEKITIDP